MFDVEQETLDWAHKPFDVVTNKDGDVGYIEEVNVNSSQKTPNEQISYSVRWLVGKETKSAWFDHHELIRHTNIFIEIAKSACHPFGNNELQVESLFKGIARGDND